MATLYWLGRARAVAQVTTIAIGGTWIAGEAVTLTINGIDLVVVIGSAVTTSNVARALAEAWEADDPTDSTVTYTPAGGGPSIPEFSEITADFDGSDLVLTGDTAGLPFTVTVATDSASGTVGSPTNETAPTGPNHWDNADNWSGAAVPANGDTVHIADGEVSILHGLAQSAVTLAALLIGQRWTGQLGLPLVNETLGYREYRATELAIGATLFTQGIGTGSGSGRVKINFGSVQTTTKIMNTGSALDAGLPATLLRGAHTSNAFELQAGSLGLALFPTETTTAALLQSGGQLYLGAGVTVKNVTKLAGYLVADGVTTSSTSTLTLKG